MLKFFVIFVFCATFFLRGSDAAECSSQSVKFTKTYTSFIIQSDSTDLADKNCTYTFSMPKYFIPKVTVTAVTLTGQNKITLRQNSEYGGQQTYDLNTVAIWTLAPIDFTLEISLPAKTVNDKFSIIVEVKDGTPHGVSVPFMVKKNLGTIIDSDSVIGNSTMSQIFDADHPQLTYTIRAATFTPDVLLYNLIQQIYIYDMGQYMGSLLDVYLAQTVSRICRGRQLTIVNTNFGTTGIYSILVSPDYNFNGAVSLRATPTGNATEVFNAASGLTVFHEISNPYVGTAAPSVYQQLKINGNTNVQVYAGCVTGPDENKRIATITPSNAANYEKLMLFGRCKTYVVNEGTFQWSKQDFELMEYKHSIGQKGVIMSDSYPYVSADTTTRKYLIQAPTNNQNIIVTYEVAYLSGNSVFSIEESIKAGKTKTESLTGSSTNLTSPSTFQQMSTFTVPKGSDGLLVRYTVTSSSNSLFSASLLLISSLIYRYL